MIFVTLGSQKFQFNRLLIEIDNLIENGTIKEKVFAQIGYSDYQPKHFKYKQFLDRDEFSQYQEQASIVITHGGTGAIVGALKKEKKVIAVPRLAKYGEHVDDHQLEIISIFSSTNYVLTCTEISDLKEIFQNLINKETRPFVSNNEIFISHIRENLNYKKKNNRKTYLDVLRIIAIILVLFNHTLGFHLFYTNGANIFSNAFNDAIALLTKINVPLFFMISGTLLLSKSENISKVLKNRAIRIISAIFIFTFLLCVKEWVFKVSSFQDIILYFTTGSLRNSYWFLYAYLAAIVCLPFIREFKFNTELFIYMFLLRLVFLSVLPILNLFSPLSISLSNYFTIPFVQVDFIFFMLLGFYLDRVNIDKINMKKLTCLFVSVLFINILIIEYDASIVGYSQNYIKLFDYLYASYVFILVKIISLNRNMDSKIITLLSSVSFGIYLLEPFIQGIITKVINLIVINTLLSSVLIVLIEVVAGTIAVVLLKKIPILKKIL